MKQFNSLFKIFKFETKLILRISGFPKLNLIRKFFWKLCSKNIYLITCPSIELKNQLKKLNIFENKKIPTLSLVECKLETGRTHQIRTHLAHKKLPIIGDKTYNTRKIIAKDTPDELKDFIRSFPRQALHAHKIGFKLPDSEDYVEFESKIPKDFKELITTLEKFNIS